MKNILRLKGSTKLISAFATFLILSGLSYIILPTLKDSTIRQAGVQTNKSILQKIEAVPPSQEDFKLGKPSTLSLPRLGIRLNILDGYYDNTRQQWTIDKVNAFNMAGSKTPLLYGHNKDPVFGRLSGAAPDELLVITNIEGKRLLFKFESDSVLKPDQSGIISLFTDNTVYLMTCTGAFNEYRRVLAFKYVGDVSSLKSSKVTRL